MLDLKTQAVIQSSSEDKWPNSEQTTAQRLLLQSSTRTRKFRDWDMAAFQTKLRLAMQLDSGPMRRRTTHALRSTVPCFN